MENEHPASDRSIIDLLKSDYEGIKEIKDLYLPIVGWELTGLSIKYRLPESGAELDVVARNAFQKVDRKDQYKRGLTLAIDTMIHLSEGLYVKPRGAEDYIELDPNLNGAPLNMSDGEELSTIFGWTDITTASQVLRKLFNNNDIALTNHAAKLNRWLVDTKADMTVELWELGDFQ